MRRKPLAKLLKPVSENAEVVRLRSSHVFENDKVQSLPGKPVRPLLLALLARQGGNHGQG